VFVAMFVLRLVGGELHAAFSTNEGTQRLQS
jgi:hypothetical protein